MADETRAEPKFERALVVAAHPDDPEFGFGGAIAKLSDEGCQVFYCICTDGSQGGEDPSVPDAELTARRYAEQRDAAALLGVSDVSFLGFRDGSLAPGPELRRAITREIRARKPDLVMTHHPTRVLLTQGIGAFHPDHLAVGEATFAAVYPDARNPRAYPELLQEGLDPWKVREVWVNGLENPDHFIDATPYVERKIAAIKAHRSQFEKPDMTDDAPRKWVLDRMRRTGEAAGFEYAEAYRRVETG